MATTTLKNGSLAEAKKLGMSSLKYKKFLKIREKGDKVLNGGVFKNRKEMQNSSRYVEKMRGYDVN